MKLREERAIISNYETYLNYIKSTFKIDFIEAIHKYAEDKGYSPEEELFDDFFNGFVLDTYTQEFFTKLKMQMSEAQYDVTTRVLTAYTFHIFNFDKAGKQIFKFQKDITTKLNDTNIKKVDGYFVRLPAKSVYFSYPYNSEVHISNGVQGNLLVKGVYIYMNDITEKIIVDKTYYPEDNARLIKILAIAGNPADLTKQITFFATMVVKEGEDVFKSIENTLKNYLLNSTNLIIKNAEALFKLVLNSILYINSANAEINPVKAKYNKQARTFQEKAKEAPYSRINFKSVGDSITIERGYKESIDNSNKGKREIKALHWLVRPHVRMQAWGKDRSERKIIWIERFEKGKDLGAKITPKTYKVK